MLLFKRKTKEKRIAGGKPAPKKDSTKSTVKKIRGKKPALKKKIGKTAAHKPLPRKKVGQTVRKNAPVKPQKRTTTRETAPAKKTASAAKKYAHPKIRAGEFANINKQSAHGHLGVVTKRYKNGKMDAITVTDSEKYPKHKKVELIENPDPNKLNTKVFLNKRVHKGVVDKDIGTRRPKVQIKNTVDKSKLRKLKTEAKRKK